MQVSPIDFDGRISHNKDMTDIEMTQRLQKLLDLAEAQFAAARIASLVAHRDLGTALALKEAAFQRVDYAAYAIAEDLQEEAYDLFHFTDVKLKEAQIALDFATRIFLEG